MFENERVEFKVRATDEIYKEVIAFANTDGGTVYVGVDDQGRVVGLADVDEELTRITNGIRDAIMPDVTMFVKFSLQENRVVKISVSEGTNKPYYLKGKGLKPSGVYVRQGASSASASPDAIRKMIKESDGEVFEEMRAMKQELSFGAAAAAFARYGVAFSEEKYTALGMIKPGEALFTNLALLLSDQCEHTVKVAVFGDTENTVFKDRREFGGSIFKQMEDAFAYLQLCNKTAASFLGLERIECADYPEEALREALLNALIHRDYGFSGSVIVNVNEESAEFISLGGLLPGLSAEDIRSGISQPRNKGLAEVFHRLRLIESYGTGIRRIFRLYEDCIEQPRIELTPNTFKIILPNRNTQENGYMNVLRDRARDQRYPGGAVSVMRDAPAEKRSGSTLLGLSPQMEQVVDYVVMHGQVTEEELQELLGVKKTRAYVLAKQMCEMGVLQAVGRGSYKCYVLR